MVPISYKQANSNQEGILGLIFQYLPSMVITAGNFVVPLLCDQIALIEQYSPSTTVIIALLRFALETKENMIIKRFKKNLLHMEIQTQWWKNSKPLLK